MKKVKEFATNKLSELLADGYKLLLGGDGSYGYKVNVKLEKDGKQYLFAVEDTYDIVDNTSIYGADVWLKPLVNNFPSVTECLFIKKYYLLNYERWDDKGYYTDDVKRAVNAAKTHYKRMVARQVKDVMFECTAERVLAHVHKHKGFKRAKEVLITKRENQYRYGVERYYTVSYGFKSYDVHFKAVR